MSCYRHTPTRMRTDDREVSLGRRHAETGWQTLCSAWGRGSMGLKSPQRRSESACHPVFAYVGLAHAVADDAHMSILRLRNCSRPLALCAHTIVPCTRVACHPHAKFRLTFPLFVRGAGAPGRHIRLQQGEQNIREVFQGGPARARVLRGEGAAPVRSG